MSVSLRKLRQDLIEILHILELGDRELSLLLVGDEEIRELNRRYLDRDRPTNVLSFPMMEGVVLGDVVVSIDTAARDARDAGIPLADELLFLMIHGILHLAGYDHESPESDEEAMKKKEKELFRHLRGYEIE